MCAELPYCDLIRLVIGSFLACSALVLGAAGCSNENDAVSCDVTVGEARTIVSLDTKVGSSSVAKVGGYSVTFSVVVGQKLEAEVRDAKSTLMKDTAGDVAGRAGGSAGTPDGQLEFTCAP